jgi:organic hydroperoxide reductase OsmC/OhrA
MAVSADSALSVVIELNAQADVPGLTDADLQTHAEAAKNHCPVAKALTWPQISLHAQQVK